MLNNQKNIVITGATSGIGYAAADILAAAGRHIVIVGRDETRTTTACELLRGIHPDADFSCKICDLARREEIKDLATSILNEFGRVDCLINNAGIYTSSRETVERGIEAQFAVNLLAPFQLSMLLMPGLMKAEDGRIINMVSGSHFYGRMRWNNLQMKGFYTGIRAYAQSKLGLVLITYHMAKLLKKRSTVTVNAADPGLVDTDVGFKHSGGISRRIWNIRKGGGQSARQGASTCVFLAESLEVKGISGYYWKNSKPMLSSARSYREKDAEKLWKTCETLSGISRKDYNIKK